jgi:hypothetical protein
MPYRNRSFSSQEESTIPIGVADIEGGERYLTVVVIAKRVLAALATAA